MSDAGALRETQEHDWRTTRGQLTPPEDESVAVRMIWLAEVFDPSTVPHLGHALEDDRVGPRTLSTKETLGGLRRSRTSGSWSAQWDMGYFVPRNSDLPLLFGGRCVDLPEGVLLAVPTLPISSDAISVLVCGFLLDDSAGRLVDAALRKTHRSTMHRKGEVLSFHPPEMAQRDAVRAARAQARSELGKWMERFGGAFANGLSPRLPAAEMLTHRTLA